MLAILLAAAPCYAAQGADPEEEPVEVKEGEVVDADDKATDKDKGDKPPDAAPGGSGGSDAKTDAEADDDDDDDNDNDDNDDNDDDDDDDAGIEPPPRKIPLSDEERRAVAAQAALETARPRSDLAEVEPPPAPQWERRLELGGDFVLVWRPFTNGLDESPIDYALAPGWGLHMQWPLVSWLRLQPYFVDVHHSIEIPQGALVVADPPSGRTISAAATVSDESVVTFVFGAKLAPTWNITPRLRAWVAGGIGWGRFEFPEMTITETTGEEILIRERSSVFVEFPFSIGASFDIIERWLAIEYEATGAPVAGQSGSGHEPFQAVDANGKTLDVGPFGAIEASFVQRLGLSLIL